MNKTVTIAIIIIAAIVVATVLTLLNVSPIVDWMRPVTDFFGSFSLSKLNAWVLAESGAVGSLISGFAVSVWQLIKTRNIVKQQMATISSKEQQISSLYGQTEQLTNYTKTQASTIDAIKAEKDQALNQAQEAQNTIQAQADAINRAKIEQETLLKQNAANFRSQLPGNTLTTDPNTGEKILTIEKVIVK